MKIDISGEAFTFDIHVESNGNVLFDGLLRLDFGDWYLGTPGNTSRLCQGRVSVVNALHRALIEITKETT